MKSFILILTFITAVTGLDAQKSVDALFKKYGGRDGFTTATLNGAMLKNCNFIDNDDDDAMPCKITEIRILAQEDESMKPENFYDLVMKDINPGQYEELLRVKESDLDVWMLVKTEGDRIKEFLLIAGGDDNALIQIKGDMSFSEAKKVSGKAMKRHGMDMVINH